ncbi:hypothetical protein JXQ70_17210 [bacterium]|nr:hypothetical protein [bacterium]
MPMTKVHKSVNKKEEQTIQEILTSLERVAHQTKRFRTISIAELRKQLGVKDKPSDQKKAILERLDLVSCFVDIVQQAFQTENLDQWARENQFKTAKNLERLVSEGILIEAKELMEQLHWTRQALSKARKAKRVFSVEIKGHNFYPSFFSDPRYERKHLEAVSRVLGDLPGTSRLQFMLTPKASLDSLTPLEALAKGKVTEVKVAAEGFVGR